MDQRRRIFGDVARRLAAGADFFRQRAVAGRAAPADPSQLFVNPAEERVPPGKVEPNLREVGLPRRQSPASARRRSPLQVLEARRARAHRSAAASAGRRRRRSSPAIENARPRRRSRRWRRSPLQFRRHDSAARPGSSLRFCDRQNEHAARASNSTQFLPRRLSVGAFAALGAPVGHCQRLAGRGRARRSVRDPGQFPPLTAEKGRQDCG